MFWGGGRMQLSAWASLRCGLAVALLVVGLSAPALARRDLAQDGKIYVNPDSFTAQSATLLEDQAKVDALNLAKVPSATWFTDGTPVDVEQKVRGLVKRAAAAGAVPVLVAYNIPWRDCALYSAGGAASGDAYLAWIKGFAAGIGDDRAIIVLEPDSLGVIPWHRTMRGELENCRPKDVDLATISEARFAQLRAAVEILSVRRNAKIYLDGTTSSWLVPGEAVSRLVRANVAKADGFFLNVSNFESDMRVTKYARWLSDCLALVMKGGYPAENCPSQYSPATFSNDSTWRQTDEAYDRLFQGLGLRRDPWGQKHAIIDTSRNGIGSWQPPRGKYADAEIWCNPPARGLGQRPTLDAKNRYIDAFLWIKTPGASDGLCFRGTSGPTDPERGANLPAAGQWFSAQARELIQFAKPAFPSD